MKNDVSFPYTVNIIIFYYVSAYVGLWSCTSENRPSGVTCLQDLGRCGTLMDGALDFGSSSPISNSGLELCVEFLGKTLYSHRAYFHPSVYESRGGGVLPIQGCSARKGYLSQASGI